jgi:hypothetical protein
MSKVYWRVMLLLVICLLAGQLLIGAKPASAAPPAQGPGYHVVRRGETLAYIGRLYGVNYWAIAQANGIVNPNCIYAGQRLVIPGGGYRPYRPYPQQQWGGYYPQQQWGGYYPSYQWGGYYPYNCYSRRPAYYSCWRRSSYCYWDP